MALQETAPNTADVLLHITDLHFWERVWNPWRLLNKRIIGNLNVLLRRQFEYDTAQAAAFAQALTATGVHTFFAGGDFTSTATPCEFGAAARFIQQVCSPDTRMFVIPGNHDVYTFEAARRKRFEQYFAAFVPSEGYPCRRALPGGTPLILAPTACPNWLSSRGRIAAVQIDAILELVNACPDGPLAVGAHYPLLNHTAAYRNGFSRQLRNAEALRRALGATGRSILYIAGHVHRGSFTRDPLFPNMCHLTTPPLFRRHRPPAPSGCFSEVHFSSAGFFVFQHLYVNNRWTRVPLPLQE